MKKILLIILFLLVAVQAVSAENVYQIGPGGSGMIVRTSISEENAGLLANNSTLSVSTHDIVYLQFQDMGLMILYMLLAVIFAALFLWSVSSLREEMQTRRQDEENEGV
jgi:uncharacterized protein YxeA